MTERSTGIRPEREYREHLADGRFMLLRSRSSGRCMFYPRVAEPVTGNTDVGWMAASGDGTVSSTAAGNQRPPSPAYNVALIDLAEGPRMMSRVEGVAAENVRIGMPVKARIIDEDGAPLLVFDPA